MPQYKKEKSQGKVKDLREIIEDRRNKLKKSSPQPAKKKEYFTSNFKSYKATSTWNKSNSSKNLASEEGRWKKNADVQDRIQSNSRNNRFRRSLSPARREASRRDRSPIREPRASKKALYRDQVSPRRDPKNGKGTSDRYHHSPGRVSHTSQDRYADSPQWNNGSIPEGSIPERAYPQDSPLPIEDPEPTSVLISNLANYLTNNAVTNWLSQKVPVEEVKLLYYKDKKDTLRQACFAEALFVNRKEAQNAVAAWNDFEAENGCVSLEIVENGPVSHSVKN